MSQYAIVVIGYNRIKSISRLLKSLEQADYGTDTIDLIISVDNSGDDSVADYAKAYHWNHGDKKVRTFPERQGLRKHVMSCGDFLEEYQALAVFEDDIYVSPNFYHYMKSAIGFYKEDDQIAGISLYNHLWNVNANRPFLPKASKYDTYFIQFAQSWGQVWMKKQWEEFKKWYDTQGEFGGNVHIPEYVTAWPKTSWLKYHIKYCIENHKYFVYPYESLTTNFTDTGENFKVPSIGLQVPMQMDIHKEYRFAPFAADSIRYDAFFESQFLAESLGLKEEELCVDLYGTKQNRENRRYLLTMEIKDYEIKEAFALYLRPHEDNILCKMEGEQIFLYDTSVQEKNSCSHRAELFQCNYDYRGDNISLKTLGNLFRNKINRQIRR